MLLTAKQAAAYLGISLARIYRLDAWLRPSTRRRGSKQLARLYDSSVLDSYRSARPSTPKVEILPGVAAILSSRLPGRSCACGCGGIVTRRKTLDMTPRWLPGHRLPEPSLQHLPKSEQCNLYGLTPSQVEQIFESQGRRCACCRSSEPSSASSWNIDHDHVTLAVRGIVCGSCNRFIGHAVDRVTGERDNLLALDACYARARAYLLRPPLPLEEVLNERRREQAAGVKKCACGCGLIPSGKTAHYVAGHRPSSLKYAREQSRKLRAALYRHVRIELGRVVLAVHDDKAESAKTRDVVAIAARISATRNGKHWFVEHEPKILQMLAEGASWNAIGRTIGISSSTLRTRYRDRVRTRVVHEVL